MKEPLALLINDIHVSKDNIPEFEKNWDEMLKVADEYKIEDIVIGGDIWQSRSSQSLNALLAVKKAFDIAADKGFYLIVSYGNHDKVDLEAIEGYNHLFWNYSPKCLVVNDYMIATEGDDFVLLVINYFPETGSLLSRLEDAVQYCKQEFPQKVKSKSDIILYCHAGIQGALGDFDIPGEAPQEPFLDFKKVLVAHYHNRCKIKNTPIEYIGASRAHTFGEDEEKGYTILFDDGSTKFIKNQVNTRYKTIELTPDQLEDFELEKDPLYKYRLKVICDDRESRLFDRQQFLDMGFDKVEIKEITEKPKEEIATAITEKYDKKGILQEYKAYCKENELDNRLGLKYLG